MVKHKSVSRADAARNRLKPVFFLWIVALTALACSKAPGDAGSSAAGAAPVPAAPAIRLGFYAPNTLDWAQRMDQNGAVLALNLYEGLYVHKADGSGVEAGLVKDAEADEAGTTWRFTLREDARWSDGAPVTAYDLVASWRRTLAPGSASAFVAPFRLIRGVAEALDKGEAPGDESFRAASALELVVHLAAPNPRLTEALASPGFLPAPRQLLAAHPEDWMLPPHGVSNGRWRLATYESGSHAELAPNPHHRAAPRGGRVRVQFVASQQAGLDAYRAGQVDLVYGMIPIETIREYVKAGKPELVTTPVFCTYFLMVNTKRAPLSDPDLRRALHAGVDRERLTLQTLGMGQRPATHLVPEVFGASGYAPLEVPGFDAARARAALVGVEGLRPIEILFNVSQGNQLIAESVQQDWQQTLGFDVQLRAVEWKTFLGMLDRGEFDVARYADCAAFADPAEFVRLFASKNEANASGYASKTLDRLLAQVDAAADPQARNRLITQAEEILARDLPAIPLYTLTRAYLVRPCLKGFTANPRETFRFDLLDASACQ
jgi:oligopeptide transport system substrate-binding protein